jgi:DNA repair exonuclease SbcCD ATPase subunit
MSKSYLKQVSIDGFRAFRNQVNIDLVGPGVNIVVGQNGLGKSSLFEAIEWALCDDVRRLSRLPLETARRADPNEHYVNHGPNGRVASSFRVQLKYVDSFGKQCAEVTRERSRSDTEMWSSSANTSSPATILECLLDPAWSLPITDVAEYLWQTHFFAQSTHLRLTAFDKKDRGSSFAMPAGFERLDQAQKSLGGKTTRAASQRLATAVKGLKDSEFRRDAFVAQVEKYKALVSSAHAAGANDPQQSTVAWTELQTALRAIWISLGGNPDLQDGGEVGAVTSLIQKIEPSMAARRETFRSSSELPARWRILQQEVAALRASLAATRRSELDARSLAESMATTIANAEGSVQAASAQVEWNKAALLRIRRVVDALDEGDAARQSILDSQRYTAVADASRVQAEAIATEAASDLDAAVRDGNEERVLSETLVNAESLRAAVRALEADRAAALPRLTTRTATRLDREREEAVRRSLNDSLTMYEASAAHAESRVAELRAESDRFGQAIATIASAIKESDQRCPLCSSHLDIGELKRRVVALVEARDPALGIAETYARECRALVAGTVASINDSTQRILVLEQKSEALNELATQLDLRRAALANEALIAGVQWSDVEAFLGEEVLRLTDRLSALLLARGARRPTSLLRESVEIANRDRDIAVSRARALRQDLAGLLQAQHERAVVLAEASELVNRLGPTSASRAIVLLEEDIRVSQARALLERATDELSANIQRAADIAVNIADLSNTIGGLVEEHAQKENQSRVLLASWRSAGFDGFPQENTFETAVAELSGLEIDFVRLKKQRDVVDEGVRRWVNSRDCELLRRAMDAEKSEQVDDDAWLTKLESDIAAASSEVELIKRLQGQLSHVSDRLVKCKAAYVENIMLPFNRLNNRFSLALSNFPNRSTLLSPHTTKLGTSLSMQLMLHDPARSLAKKRIAEESETLSAPHILSEGQLASASLSLLFAMSATYRWSRWPALLLDDPLQQCDIVHAASFADLIGTLARDCGFQIVVSTHDFGLADFLRRKVQARDIPCQYIQFRHPGWALTESATVSG